MEPSCQVKTFYDTLNNLSILIEKLKDQAKNIIYNSSSNHSNSSCKTSCEETKTEEIISSPLEHSSFKNYEIISEDLLEVRKDRKNRKQKKIYDFIIL